MHDRHLKSKEFQRTLKYSLLITLSLLVLLFYLFPRFTDRKIQKSPAIQIPIYVSDIPQTSQTVKRSAILPTRPSGFLPIPVDDPDFPEEISFSETSGIINSQLTSHPALPEVPAKTLLEVYPSTLGVTCKGFVRVLLLINKNGQVESLEILENTTAADTCIARVKEAAFQSRWIPARVKNEAVKSWVEKIYKFNLAK